MSAWFEERLFGLYPYACSSFDSARQTISGTALSSTIKLPDVESLPIRSPKLQFVCSAGEQFLVGFAGGDPTQPFVANLDFAASYTQALPIARQGELISMTFTLVPALAGVPPVPIPNAYSLFVLPSTTVVPGAGGIYTAFGTIRTGDPRLKAG